ncbi:unnamed protein product [Rotaria magnacalcarata]|uniref:Helicase POLQ-like n=1 Tax=Rotaria magnacalcarata TaxID=392030 RepID=A0A816NKD2_9BILA|nr:unnamed protein product [Rotaria magnacalcarata]CAF4119062.1 unnamed protein product [Rotaria magnacalcarata]
MDDFDFDLIDELCSSFCTPRTSQKTNETNTPSVNESLSLSIQKRTSTCNPLDSSKIKKVCLSDVSNRSIVDEYDEISTLDESTLQMLCEEWEPRSQFPTLLTRVADLLEKYRNIQSFHNWQKKCLDLPARRKNQNLIYTLPTSGGKTLVAEIMMLNCLLHRRLDAIFILPFVAVVQEKVRSLQPFADELDFHLEEYAASKGRYPPIKRRMKRSLYVCTIEKANSLINSLIENNRMVEIGIVVVDELHMIGEGQRGAILESLLTKIRLLKPQPQIVGMSATLANIDDLLNFLDAQFYEERFRPVELEEYVKVNDMVYKIDRNKANHNDELIEHRRLDFKYTKQNLLNDPDRVVGLVSEVIPKDSCLVFCPSKINCENVARLIISFMPEKLLEDNREKRSILLETLVEVNEGDLCDTLKAAIPYGVAYHHSGLTGDERQLIEEAFLDGILTCLTCTSTLSTGVNLPAKRVILRSPYVGSHFLTFAQYKQMSGRAGRTGQSQTGECFVIAHERDMKQLREMLFTMADNNTGCDSHLATNNSYAIKQLLLNAISLRICSTYESLLNLLQKTLLALQADRLNVHLQSLLDECLQYLIDANIMRVKEVEQISDDSHVEKVKRLLYETTKLGKATVEGSVDLGLATSVYNHLATSLINMNLENPLHLLYITIPFDLPNMTIGFRQLVDRMQEMKIEEKLVFKLMDIDDTFLQKKAVGLPAQQKVSKETMLRLYVAVILYDLFKNKSFYDVAKFWDQPRGSIQNLFSQVASFATSIFYFSKSFDEFWPYQQLLPIFIQRLTFCTSLEILPLMEIPGIKRSRALQLIRAGYRTLRSLAKAQPDDLMKAVLNLPLRTAQILVKHSKRLLCEQAEDLRDQAAALVENIE